MNVLALTALLFSGAAAAGLVGALTGLGGGVVLVPLLTLGLGVDIKYAIRTALVAVIATSSGAAAAYVREGFSNVRDRPVLRDRDDDRGAPRGLSRVTRTSTPVIAVIFGDGSPRLDGVLVEGASSAAAESGGSPDPLATRLLLNGSYPSLAGERTYFPRRVPLSLAPHGRRGRGLGSPRNRLGRAQGPFNGRRPRAPLQGLDDDEQLHDRRDGRRERRRLPEPRVHRPRARRAPVVLGVLAGSALGARILVPGALERPRVSSSRPSSS